MIRSFFILVLSLFLLIEGQTQDISFSQKFVSSPYINPALTGIFSGTVRLGVQYRNQWSGPLDAGFETYAASGDLNYRLSILDQTNRDILGVGIQFINDRVEGIDFNTSLIGLTTAFHKSLNNRYDHYLGIGFQAGVIQKNINYEQLNFGDQYNNIDAYSFPTAEPLPTNNFAVGDFSVGILYLISPKKSFSYRGGIAYQHINGPNLSFFRFNEDYRENDILRKFTFHSSVNLKTGAYTEFIPRVIIQTQGPYLDSELSANIKVTTFNRDDLTFHLGLGTHFIRDLDIVGFSTIVPFVGFQLDNFLIGMSYDIGINTLVRHNRNFSTFEFSLSYLGQYDNQPMFCPKF